MTETLIDGEYRIESRIGEGAFGVVYRCEEVQLGRRVAIKMLASSSVGEREMQRFLAEARILAALNHPNIVQIYRLGSHQGTPYIVMEYLTGCTLRDLLRKERLPLDHGLGIMVGVARGLAAIHERGIVHRDLSSNNVMILDSGEAKILDLGLARDTTTLTTISAEQFLTGTLPYIAPEQIQGSGPTRQSDIFSLGVMLYETVTGKNPFAAEHYMSALYNIANRNPEPIELFVENPPTALCELVASCLAKTPGERPDSAGAIESNLNVIMTSSDLRTSRALEGPVCAGVIGSSLRNPYLSRVMLKRREDFFGRKQEVKRIYSRLNATPPGSVSIVGDRKIGKSSLLNYVYMRRNREAYLEQPENLVMVFVDLQEQVDLSLDGFVRELIGMAGYELRGRLDISDCTTDLDGIKDLVQRLDRAGYKLAILLDEFEAITRNPNFSLEFFSFLRHLANHYNVAYFTSSARDLQVLCHTKEVSDSPFFNIFTTFRLTAFRREEALELISGPSARVGKPLERWADAILEISGLLPLYIQMVCSHAIEQLEENAGGAIQIEELRGRFLEEAEPHYRYIWESFTEDERSGAARLASGKGVPDALRHIVEELERRGYVIGKERDARLFSSTFETFVRGHGGRQRKPGMLGRLFGSG